MKSLHKGTFKFSARNVSIQDVKRLEKVMAEQHRLADRLEVVMDKYEKRLEKLSRVVDQARAGDFSRLETCIRDMQKDLRGSLSRAEMALLDTKDLERELADWKSLKADSEESDRILLVASELEARGVKTVIKNISPKQDVAVVAAPENIISTAAISTQPEKHCAIKRTATKNHLKAEPEQLIRHIKDLTKELNAYQEHPESDPAESLRMAKELKNYHGRLRSLDRMKHENRDRMLLSRGLATVA